MTSQSKSANMEPLSPSGTVSYKMCNFAVIRTGGKQYRVSPGDTITIEKLSTAEKGVTFSDVLLTSGDVVVVGDPNVPGVTVTGEIVSQGRGEKLRVFKYKAKSHWSKTRGHRQELTQVRIKDIVHETKKAPRAREVTVGA